MLIQLDPGLKCKKCEARMQVGRDAAGTRNLVLNEDHGIDNAKFEAVFSCDMCTTVHEAKGFIRDGVFRGIYEYNVR